MGEIGDGLYKLPKKGVISSFFFCYSSKRMPVIWICLHFFLFYLLLIIFFLQPSFTFPHQAAFNFSAFPSERIIWFYTDLVVHGSEIVWKCQQYDSGLRRHECSIMWIASSLASSWIDADLLCIDVCLFAEYLCPRSSGSFQEAVVFAWQSCSQGRIKYLCRSFGP